MPSDLGLSEIQAHLDNLTKPPGSLGLLERLAARLCAAQGTLSPQVRPRRLVIFAGDHGVIAEGVSAWPSEVTSLMIRNIAEGGAASSVLAAAFGVELEVVDVGSLAPAANPGEAYLDRRLRAGSRNLARESALTLDEWHTAFEVGADRAQAAADAGCRVVAGGEMGIGNTTPASCWTVLLTGLEPRQAVGPGAGADPETVERKVKAVERAVARARVDLVEQPRAALASVGGFELVAMAGFFTRAVELGLTVVLDGFIASAAALAAHHLSPGVADRLIAAHRSAEPAHGVVLQTLGLEPFLQWDLRLGEGTGALLLMPMLDAAAALVTHMATFEQLGIQKG